MQAVAEACHEEYKAITDAGLIVQVDEPEFCTTWSFYPDWSVDDLRKYLSFAVEVINHALRGLPEDQVRFHACWGSGHRPHVTDIELKHIADLMLKINAQCYSSRRRNVRHEHEWQVWKDVKLPDGKILMPGVISHATDLVEHPDLVAERLVNYAERGRQGERPDRHRLRHRLAGRPRGDRLGQAGDDVRRRQARLGRALGQLSASVGAAMRGLVFKGNRQVALEDFPDPVPGPGEVVVAMRASGMCGSDLNLYRAASFDRTVDLRPRAVRRGRRARARRRRARRRRLGQRVMVHHYRGCGGASTAAWATPRCAARPR